MTPEILSHLEGVRKHSNVWKAKCPAHSDKTPSLVVRVSPEGNTLLYCFGGCSVPQIMGALGLPMTSLFADDPKTQRKLPHYEEDERWTVHEEWKQIRVKVNKITESIRRHPPLLGLVVDEAMDLVLQQLALEERFRSLTYLYAPTTKKIFDPPYCWWACTDDCFPMLEHEEGCGGCKESAVSELRLCADHQARIAYGSADKV